MAEENVTTDVTTETQNNTREYSAAEGYEQTLAKNSGDMKQKQSRIQADNIVKYIAPNGARVDNIEYIQFDYKLILIPFRFCVTKTKR